MNAIRRAGRFIRRTIRCAKILAKSNRLPKWLRVLFVIGCIQVPVLPFDEIALVMAVAIMSVFYRPQLTAAWSDSADGR